MAAEVAGRAIVIANFGEKCHALDDRCPHAGGPLSQGSIENGKLVCPWHGREYDLATGLCEAFPSVATHAVEMRDDGIYVALR